jgi:hypothetical protein
MMYETGSIATVKISELNPAQPDDGHFSLSGEHIEVYQEGGQIFILHGHHRYYRYLEERGKSGSMIVRIKRNPYDG